MKRKILLTISLIILTVLAGKFNSANAYVSYYGEVSPSGQIVLDKKVKDPSTGNFVDNLGANDYRFAPGEEIIYKVIAKNNGNLNFEKIKITDYLPSYVELVSGQTEINFEDLDVNETQEFEIKVKAVTADKFPSSQGLYCLVNRAEAVADNQTDDDTAQACVESKVLGTTTQPEAGVNLPLALLTSAGIIGLGVLLKKKFLAP